MSDDTETTEQQAVPPDPPPRKRLERSGSDRMLTGVAGGIAEYLGVDTTVVRIAVVGLTLLGGAGVLLYLAALLLMPEQGAPAPSFGRGGEGGRGQAVTVLGMLVLGAAALAGIAAIGALIGWILLPFAFLVLAGLFAWWIASGERPSGTPGQILKRAALGLGLLAICVAVALGGAYATGVGSGAVGAALVVGAGAVLVAAAFVRRARWLIMPALALGLAAGFVAATDIELDGGMGERDYHPTAPQDVKGNYKFGVGEMVVDLRDARLPAGDRHIKIELGVGHAVVLVRENVCVATDADVGIGGVDSFDSDSGGIDVRHDDARSAPAGTPRVVIDGDIGVGKLDVHHAPIDGGYGHRYEEFEPGGNEACIGGARADGDDDG